MKIDKFRNDEFVNREEEIKYLIDRFENVPKEILWLFGPKSTGKTTLIEYIIEKKLKKHWVKYINFRGLMVSNYHDFVSAFFEEKDEEERELKRKYKLGVFELEAKTLKKIRENKINLFNELIEELKQIKEPKLIVIDEIQTLQDIYLNKDKYLLKEFLNFCVRLTKELHLAHVVILSSNTLFINQIYNEAKLKVTSEFKEINHMSKETTFEYLEIKNINQKDLVWDYLGGTIAQIQRMITESKGFKSLQEYLDSELELAIGELNFFMIKKCNQEEIKIFKQIAKEIFDNGEFNLIETSEDKDKIMAVIEKFSEIEFLFYNPLNNKITANNRLYYKAFGEL